MVKENQREENKTIYEINNKKYTVITRTIANAQNLDKLYDAICKYAISQIN